MRRTGFAAVLLGMSGGSCLAAPIVADAPPIVTPAADLAVGLGAFLLPLLQAIDVTAGQIAAEYTFDGSMLRLKDPARDNAVQVLELVLGGEIAHLNQSIAIIEDILAATSSPITTPVIGTFTVFDLAIPCAGAASFVCAGQVLEKLSAGGLNLGPAPAVPAPDTPAPGTAAPIPSPGTALIAGVLLLPLASRLRRPAA